MGKFLTFALCLILSAPVFAQDATTEGATDQASGSSTRASTPKEITRAVHGSWQIRCVTVEPVQCFLFQLIVGENNTPLVEYSLVPAKDETDSDVQLAATMVTPLNVVLPQGILLQIDDNEDTIERLRYGWCSPVGCFSRFPINGAKLEEYKKGTSMKAVIFSIQNPGTGLEINLPLDGFSEAYDELMEIEANG